MVGFVIVDDEKWVRSLLRNILPWHSLGFRILGEASDGAEAMRLVRVTTPDIVLTDIRMHGVNGLDFIKAVRELSMDTKIVIISGYDEFAYAKQAIEYGVSGYLVKPIEEQELLEIMVRAKDDIAKEKKESENRVELEANISRLREIVHWKDRRKPGPTDCVVDDPRIQKAVDLVADQYAETIGSSDIARRVFMSEAYFSDKFHRVVGKTFSAYLTEFRIGVAMDLLRQPELRIKDVARLVGFGSANYFCRVFREVVGVTPGAYRR